MLRLTVTGDGEESAMNKKKNTPERFCNFFSSYVNFRKLSSFHS